MERMLMALLLTTAIGAACADLQVGTLTTTRRVLREDSPGSQRTVAVAAARNEWVSFQVLLRSDRAVSDLTLAPGDLHGPGGTTLAASATARLYREHQFLLDVPSFRNDSFRPGWYPDALIPFRHPLTGKPLTGARFQAVPFSLPADQTHGFLVDLFVPKETPPGDYRGAYRVSAPSVPSVTIPVTLTVWDFALPDTPTLQTALGSPAQRMKGYYAQRAKQGKEPAPKDWAAVETVCAEMLSEHRINATPPAGSLVPVEQPDGSFRIPAEQLAAFQQFVDRYHLNAFCVPHPRSVVKDPEKEQTRLRAWLKAWDEAARKLNRPQVTFYTYLRDEPNDEKAYHYVQKWGRAIRQAQSVVKVLVVEQTWTQNPQWGDLYGAVDIWCPLFSLFKEESALKRQKLGETVWTYTALCQGDPTPWWETDFPLLNYRCPCWIAWRYGIRGLLYWGGMSYWRQIDDPWTDPKTLDRRKRRNELLYNGEGSLVYPARAVGYDGIVPSLRLKALRDGIEDYEYLALLDRAGKAAAARRLVLPLAESWFKWEKDPAAYQRVRAELADLLSAPE